MSNRLCPGLGASLAVALLLPGLAAAQTSCTARTSATATPVVELYTSEGCNSCPPADRWLSSLQRRATLVALAFHVDYWDRLGWSDKFARPAYSERQRQQQAVNGAAFSYTPQVVVDGIDRKDWWRVQLSGLEPRPATVEIVLTQRGPQFEASVRGLPGAPRRLAAYWAVTEDHHRSEVAAGENKGVNLTHDHVVRELEPVAAWTSHDGGQATLHFTPAGARDTHHPRSINLVVLDAASSRPVQALKIGC